MDFWDRLKARVKQQNTTQEWVSTKANVPFRTLQNWIYTNRLPDASQAVAIAAALGTTVEELVTGKAPGDEWIAQHRDLIADLKALPPDKLEDVADMVHTVASKVRAAAANTHANATG